MKRRAFFSYPALAGMSAYVLDLAAEAETLPSGSITDVEGIKVGHSTRTDRPPAAPFSSPRKVPRAR